MYRRRSSSVEVRSPHGVKMHVLLGGRDAPMGPRDNRLFQIIAGTTVVIAVVIAALLLLG